jgi:hypothetical protein
VGWAFEWGAGKKGRLLGYGPKPALSVNTRPEQSALFVFAYALHGALLAAAPPHQGARRIQNMANQNFKVARIGVNSSQIFFL